MRETRMQAVRKAKGKRTIESPANESEHTVVKRQRKQGADEDSDDDFQVQPLRSVVGNEVIENVVKKNSMKEIKSGCRSLRTRSLIGLNLQVYKCRYSNKFR
ncbi:unnamed protein product [Cuscuta europaea]|uniref:Uncharacterized protein n=1 Tax=Cuscuta europaea TaxID=41803 RepID=A0A9P1ECL8_CUSEU|nr:unnamed protein product [Cuscuta europaea]